MYTGRRTDPTTSRAVIIGLFQAKVVPPQERAKHRATTHIAMRMIPPKSTSLNDTPGRFRLGIFLTKRRRMATAGPDRMRLIQKHHRQLNRVKIPPRT